MFKNMLVVAAVLAVLAVPSGGLASNDTQYYPLTLTVQPALHVHGKTAGFLLTVTNSSTTRSFAPLVRLDQNARLASSSQFLMGNKVTTWPVGKLRPGQSKTLTISYYRIVKFPPYKDPATGEKKTPPPGIIGKTYPPSFTLYDPYYHLYTFVGVPVKPGMMK